MSSRWSAGSLEFASKGQAIAAQLLGDLSPTEKSSYSVCRAILNASPEEKRGRSLETDISDTIAAKVGRASQGIYVPTRLRAAGLDTRSNVAGGYAGGTEIGDLIELLRQRTKVIQLGATVLSGLQGNQSFPKQATASSGFWMAQNPGSDVADSDATFGAVTLSPKTYQASTSFSRQFLMQSTIDAEAFVRGDLATAHALAIDAAALNGSGVSNQPLGLIGTSGIGSVALGTNGLIPTYDAIVDLETAVANANGDEAGMKFLTTPPMRGKLRKIQQFSGTNGKPVWQGLQGAPGVGDLDGYEAYVSKQVPSNLTKGTSNGICHAILFGYWPSLLIGEWGILELVVDPFRLKRQNMIEVTSFQMCDVAVRQPANFAAILDALLS